VGVFGAFIEQQNDPNSTQGGSFTNLAEFVQQTVFTRVPCGASDSNSAGLYRWADDQIIYVPMRSLIV